MADLTRYQVLIVGGGTAGITMAARLKRARKGLEIAIVEPAAKHYYQPLWTLVGGGVFPKAVTERAEADYIPAGVTWVKDSVAEFRPDTNTVKLQSGHELGYAFLIVAPGLQLDWAKVKGLPEALGHDGVASNYSYATVDKTWEFLQAVKGGNVIFTHPNTPIKCGGAPQKIAYLADDYLRRAGVRERANIIFATAQPELFHVPQYTRELEKVAARKGIDVRVKHNLVEVDAAARTAVFERLDTGERVVLPYSMLHVTPPMSAPDVVKASPLADAAGWVDVDKQQLQHKRYPNVFSLGDASNLPTSKTGAAIRKQAPVLVQNLLAAMDGRPLLGRYGGYTSCPLVTGYGKLILAEFDYEKNSQETFPFDQRKERYSMYLLKKYGLPAFYWHGMLRGRM